MRTPARIVWLLIVVLVVYEVSWTCLSSSSLSSVRRTYLGHDSASSDEGRRQTSQFTTRAKASFWRTLRRAHVTTEDENSKTEGEGFPVQFPKKVWQTSSEAGRLQWAKPSQSWKDLEGWDYQFLSDEDADAFVDTKFSTQPSIPAFWHALRSHVVRADMLRYLVMLAEGGVYSDIDTTVLIPPDQWIPSNIDPSAVNAVVGIEYDDTTYPLFVRPISFCQWTLFSKPNHPIFNLAVTRLISNLEFVARRKFVDLNALELDKKEILAATGPGMITDVIVQAIQDQGMNITWASFHDIKEPRLYGDILVLPINGFAGNQKHSHAGDPEYGEHFVQHHFARSWYVRPTSPKTPQPPPAAQHPIDHKKAVSHLQQTTKENQFMAADDDDDDEEMALRKGR